MAQQKVIVDLHAVEFPLLYEWASRTVIQPTVKEPAAPVTTPQLLYAQDILPTQQGIKSVSYKDLLPASVPANVTFRQLFNVADAAQNKAIIGITYDSKIFMVTYGSSIWVDITPGGWGGSDAVTVGNANGIYYLYLGNKGCYEVVITTPGLTLRALAGITAANILGMTSAVNYLILWDATGTIYWSSTVNPLDFVPSLVTGAGSSIPTDLLGRIIICIPLGTGFAIYTNTNIVLAPFSGNTQYPWIFHAAENSSGIIDYRQVSFTHDLSFHIAITFAGILNVTSRGCEVMVPEISDFLAARLYESYNTITNTITKQVLVSTLLTRVNVIGARYIVLSYGITEFTDVIVYDLALKRFGKLRITHVCCFEIGTSMETTIAPYNEASEIGQTYAAASPQTYNSTAQSFNNPPLIGRTFGFLLKDGSIRLAYLDYNSTADTGIALFGKYQAVRNNMLAIHEVAIETPAASGFTLNVLSSINGKDISSVVTPVLTDSNTGVDVYKCRSSARNHTLACKGSFDLSTIELTISLEGRR